MKIKQLIAVVVLSFCFIYEGQAQATFSVSPGFALNGAQLGYRVNSKLIPYISFQYLSSRITIDESGTRINDASTGTESYSSEHLAKGTIFIPSIGAKYFVSSKGKLKSYIQGAFTKPFLSAKIEDDGVEDETIKEDLEKLSIWGGELSFGVEYFFDENFSLGGEFGLRGFHAKYKENSEREETYFNQDTQQNETVTLRSETETNVSFSPTFTRVSLNFYF
ncbi:hypothetical protein [Luteibaculum oceani]|uniref:Outer membrane protein beta-barrel domain-containing protein n=1 Tax=Luteibaculum oceani TaxID=1294296 RepID=A0A5C6VJ56_9FLAO|nr:hypothetical protein [Luteibaculum oceani]TXC85257.1 hypothetical protein FRX97_01135 [Luteibaculum oceani]